FFFCFLFILLMHSCFFICIFIFFFFKQKTAYEITRRDWSSDVCSSDLRAQPERRRRSRASRAAGRSSHERACRLLQRTRMRKSRRRAAGARIHGGAISAEY